MRWPLPWRSVPEFIVDNPWAAGVIEWLGVLKNFWDQYNSLLVLVGLWLVARKLKGERERLEERVDTLGQHVKAATEAADGAIAAAQEASDRLVTAMADARAERTNGAHTPTPLQPAEADNANWNRLNSIWSELKDRIDVLISEIPRKRVRAKYSRMHRRTYKHIIEALQKDGVIEGVLGQMLIDLDRKYSALRFRPKEVIPEDVELFGRIRNIVNKTGPLPPSPSEPSVNGGDSAPAAQIYRNTSLNGTDEPAAARAVS